jgi:hypothetical protein
MLAGFMFGCLSIVASGAVAARDIAAEFGGHGSEGLPLDGLPNAVIGLLGFGLVVKAFERSIWLGIPALAGLVALVFAMVAMPVLPWLLLAGVVVWLIGDMLWQHFRN